MKFKEYGSCAKMKDDKLITIKGAHILLAEDVVLNQKVVMGLLGKNVRIDIAENGKDAVDLIGSRSYDLVLMDLQMPVMDGLEATRQIRGSLRQKDLPIIAMTADDMDSTKEGCLNAGMNAHLIKPIDPEQLVMTLLKWIPPKQANTDNPSHVPAQQMTITEEELLLQINIPGLDIESGLKRLLNQQKTYIKLLGKYVSGQKEIFADIENALALNDWDTAIRYVHSLKGVSGTIGATLVESSAAALESAMKEHLSSETIESFSQNTRSLLTELISRLEEVLGVENMEKQRPADDGIYSAPETIRNIIIELQPNLKTAKPKKITGIMEKYRLLSWPPELRSEANELERLVSKYNFKEAANLSVNLLNKILMPVGLPEENLL